MTSIAFSGDISFSKHFKGHEEDHGLVTEDVCSFLSSADYTVLNVECALTDKATTVTGSDPAHASSPKCIALLKKLGGNVWNLANNHTLDCGKEGIQDTMALASQAGAQTLGVGETLEKASKPLILSGAGGIGLVAVCYKKKYVAGEETPGYVHWQDFKRVRAMIQAVKQQCRWCIVVAHAGEEFSSLPLPNVRRNYMRYLRMGADIVVGHHPHVPQNYERFGKRTIFYSLGNFIFDTDYQRLQAHTAEGVLLKLHFDEKSYHFEAIGIQIDRAMHSVRLSALPYVFRHVGGCDYRKLLPLITNRYFDNIKRAREYLTPNAKQFTAQQWDVWFTRTRGEKVYRGWMRQLEKYKKQGCRYHDEQFIKYINEDS